MGNKRLRNVADWALASLKARARRKGTSLEQEVRAAIEQMAELTLEEIVIAAREEDDQTRGSPVEPRGDSRGAGVNKCRRGRRRKPSALVV